MASAVSATMERIFASSKFMSIPAYRNTERICSDTSDNAVTFPYTQLTSAKVGIPEHFTTSPSGIVHFICAAVPAQLLTNWDAVNEVFKLFCREVKGVSDFFASGLPSCSGDSTACIAFCRFVSIFRPFLKNP